jgi:5,10-methenyltetrahydrofolate synthetase
MLARRDAMSALEHQRLSAQIATALQGVFEQLQPRCVGFCWPWRGEFDAREEVANWLARHRDCRAALPVIEQTGAALRFREWTPESVMAPGPFGIPAPVSGEWCVPDVMLLPVVAIDPAGFRLGYGGGYFDRTLAAMQPRPVTVGLGFDFQQVASIAPEPWDVPLDWRVSEAGAVKIAGCR